MRKILIALSSGFLISCGSGSSNSAAEPTPTPSFTPSPTPSPTASPSIAVDWSMESPAVALYKITGDNNIIGSLRLVSKSEGLLLISQYFESNILGLAASISNYNESSSDCILTTPVSGTYNNNSVSGSISLNQCSINNQGLTAQVDINLNGMPPISESVTATQQTVASVEQIQQLLADLPSQTYYTKLVYPGYSSSFYYIGNINGNSGQNVFGYILVNILNGTAMPLKFKGGSGKVIVEKVIDASSFQVYVYVNLQTNLLKNIASINPLLKTIIPESGSQYATCNVLANGLIESNQLSTNGTASVTSCQINGQPESAVWYVNFTPNVTPNV